MKRIWKILCVVSLILLLSGGAIFGVGILVAKGDIKSLSHLKSVQETYTETANNEITSVAVDYNDADVKVIFSETAEKVTLSYPRLLTKKNQPASEIYLSDTNGKLQIRERILWRKTWLNWNFTDMELVLTLPAARSYALSIETDNGDINLTGASSNLTSLRLSTDNGDIETKGVNIVCSGNIDVESDNGDIELGKFSAVNVTAEIDNGDIELSGGNASGKIELSSDNGEIEIKGALVANTISVETDNGGVYAMNGILDAQRVAIETDNGNVKIRLIGEQSDYSIYVRTDNGKSNVRSQAGGDRNLSLDSDNGDIFVSFINY